MKTSKTPYTDLIDALPNLFGIFGSKRRQIEREADERGVDRDHTNGVDDDFTAWNLPEEK